MLYLKKYGLRLIYTIMSILLSLLVVTTFYYFDLINGTTYSILKIIIILLNIFISSFILGKKAINKGYLEGIKLAVIIIPIFIILALITKEVFKLRVILYYLIIFITSTFGGMVGISRNKET